MTTYHRYTNGSCDTGIGYMMFADDIDAVRGVYGANHYTVSLTDIGADNIIRAGSEEFRAMVVSALSSREDILDEFGATAESLADTINPANIVDSAGLWDAPELVSVIYEMVIEANDIIAVVTDNGVILFDESLSVAA